MWIVNVININMAEGLWCRRLLEDFVLIKGNFYKNVGT